MAWYGMVWYGMVWCRWYGWYGMKWYGMKWYGTVWYATRAKIHQVDATLLVEQRLSNVVIKVQQHLLN